MNTVWLLREDFLCTFWSQSLISSLKNYLSTFTKFSKKTSKSFSEFPQPKLKRKLANASVSLKPIAVSTCDGKVVAELQAEPLEIATL